MENTYYIHINTNSLPHYLAEGIIRPSNLIKNKESDFQNNSEKQIILSNKKWNKTNDCSIEVVINDEEKVNLEQISTDFLLCHTALPISRIKNVYFENKEKAETVIWNINNTVAFVPSRAIKFENKIEEELVKNYPNTYNTSKQDNTKDLTNALKRFDRLLGGFAFLKVSSEIGSNNTINFSESYLSTLAFFNKLIESELKANNFIIEERFHKIFKGDSKIFNYLAKKIDISLVEEVARDESIQLNTKFGVIDLTNVPKETLTFKLAVLETYGKDNSKSVEDLITSLLQKLSENTSDEIALIYGLHVGYRALRNYYKIENEKIQVKYDLNSKMDFYTIESIYQYAFNDKKISNGYDYLNIDFVVNYNKKIIPEFKYITILNESYPYKKIDYKEQKATIIKFLTKEISQWFPSDLFNINEEKILEKISTLINPKLNELVIEVRKDTKNFFDINKTSELATDSHILNLNNKKINNLQKENNIQEREDINKQNKVSVAEPLLFNYNIQNKPKPFNAMELDKLTIPKLRKYAEELKIKIPKGIKAKADIIKIILSNQY